MNKLELMKIRNENKQKFEHSSVHTNLIKIYPKTTKHGTISAHEIAKFNLCFFIQASGKEYLTEPKFKNGAGRPDIYILDNNTAIEIVDTESEESIEEKRKKYPCDIIIIKSERARYTTIAQLLLKKYGVI